MANRKVDANFTPKFLPGAGAGAGPAGAAGAGGQGPTIEEVD